ncbi:hypothetical protein PVAND_012090 [Polypedilum vanderplanki]|uniref:Major facilitator superfamily (MFS) profile domain-containing protein n=1 Tax=Polypedilum vanderplanki TaxID=319348 RepID=A0A9J6CLD1_POLVA|nr:hypothetical protein PVAND_012090 [Polypedilum vanderplanki]
MEREQLKLQTEDVYEKKENNKNTKRQFCGAIFMSLLAFSYGCTCGWTSSAIVILQSNDTPLITGPINSEQAGWIGSSIGIGGFVANFFFGWLSERVGRKVSLYCVVIPQILSWIFIYTARTPIYLIIARILGGTAGGGMLAIVPTFIAEIADDHVRGILGSLVILFCNTGLFFAYVCGGFFDYYTNPWMMLPFPIAFIILFLKFPDSPISLMKRKRYDEAEESIIFYKSMRTYSKQTKQLLEDEIQKLQSDDDNAEKPSLESIYKSRASRKAILIGIGLMALNQYTGGFALITFTSSIFKESGSNLSLTASSIIVAVIQIFGALTATFLVEKAGRKLMMSVSSFGMMTGLGVLATYSLFKSQGVDLSNYNIVPLLSFSFMIFVGNLGVLTLPFMIVNEIAPAKIRGLASTICMSFCWFFVFTAVNYFPSLMDSLGMHGAVYIFAFNSLIGGLFVLLCIPETKGKSAEEIMRIMEK